MTTTSTPKADMPDESDVQDAARSEKYRAAGERVREAIAARKAKAEATIAARATPASAPAVTVAPPAPVTPRVYDPYSVEAPAVVRAREAAKASAASGEAPAPVAQPKPNNIKPLIALARKNQEAAQKEANKRLRRDPATGKPTREYQRQLDDQKIQYRLDKGGDPVRAYEPVTGDTPEEIKKNRLERIREQDRQRKAANRAAKKQAAAQDAADHYAGVTGFGNF